MKTHHCMLDLETLGTRPGDVVLSIGACLFDKEEGVYSTFYRTIDVESSRALGLKSQKSTREWWAKQSPEAQAQAFAGEMPVAQALEEFRLWLPPAERLLVYGNGADFDLPILAAVFRAAQKDTPWSPWAGRCYRTLKNLCPDVKIERLGTYHNALDDAKSQALHLLKIVEVTGIKLG